MGTAVHGYTEWSSLCKRFGPLIGRFASRDVSGGTLLFPNCTSLREISLPLALSEAKNTRWTMR